MNKFLSQDNFRNAVDENTDGIFKRSILIAVMCIFISLLFSSCKIQPTEVLEYKENPNENLQEKEVKREPITLKISCIGDVMCHDVQFYAQEKEDGSYDFSNNYKYIKKYIEDKDLAICNLETTFAGKPYAGYPAFSTPDELAKALSNAGFDVAITANNHMVDRGYDGVLRTLSVLRENSLKTAGSKLPEEKDKFVIVDVKGVKVGIVPYTYENTPAGSEAISINGNYISDKTAELINSFSFANIDEDFEKIKADCKKAKEDGAEILIVYYHWGEEYQTVANHWQEELAKRTVEETDVDVIFASHPHVLQQVELMENNQGKKVPIYYSMGNFISNQRYETLRNKNTEVGIVANVQFTVDKENDKVALDEYSALPIWVSRYRENGKTVYEVIPLDDKVEENETLIKTGKVGRGKEAKGEAYEILGLDRIK